MSKEISIKLIRQAVADYVLSEGCTCCEGGDHDDHLKRLAKLLNVKKYDDKSGYDFHHYIS